MSAFRWTLATLLSHWRRRPGQLAALMAAHSARLAAMRGRTLRLRAGPGGGGCGVSAFRWTLATLLSHRRRRPGQLAALMAAHSARLAAMRGRTVRLHAGRVAEAAA